MIAVAAAKGAAKGVSKVREIASENPSGTLLVGVVILGVVLLLKSGVLRNVLPTPSLPDPGEVFDAVTPDAVQPFILGQWDDLRYWPLNPAQQVRLSVDQSQDFIGGFFSNPNAFDPELEDDPEPVIVPRPAPTNRAADAGGDFRYVLTQASPGEIFQYFKGLF